MFNQVDNLLLNLRHNQVDQLLNQLANGLAKLQSTSRESLQGVGVEEGVVAQSQKDCEDLLVQIVSEKRGEQRRHVEADSERIRGMQSDLR